MADPFHGNRAKKQDAVHTAYQKAMSIPKPQAPRPMDVGDHAFDSKKVYLHPVHRYQMNEWEYKVYMQEEKDKEDERLAGMATLEKTMGGAGGGVRENQQYTLALKTAFELGMNAGLMQRPPPPPCSACERRKERNRLAAQTSRVEKRRLELMYPQPQRRDVVGRVIRSTSGPAPPAPTFHFPSTTASTASKVEQKEQSQEEDEEDADEDEEDAEEDETHLQPPPF